MFDMQVFDYEDIQLIPNKCIVDSRSECDTSVTLG
ncbi:GMP reductase, partial [Tetragenococcus halophilus]